MRSYSSKWVRPSDGRPYEKRGVCTRTETPRRKRPPRTEGLHPTTEAGGRGKLLAGSSATARLPAP